MDRFKFRAWSFQERDMLNWDDLTRFPCSVYGLFVDKRELGPGFWNVMQCTSFKDENGKLVYEEDIVEINNGDKCLVVWDEDDASFWLESTATGERYPFYCSTIIKVLGNIHENKDLLEGK